MATRATTMADERRLLWITLGALTLAILAALLPSRAR